MRMLFRAILAGLIALSGNALAQDRTVHFAMDSKVLTPPPGLQVLATVGQNDNAAEISTNKAPPESLRDGLFYAPHGITYNSKGNLLVTEFNQWGRVSRLIRQ